MKTSREQQFLENVYNSIAVDIGYGSITKKQRDKIPLQDFAWPEQRKFPITDQAHLDAAVKLIGRAPPGKQAAIKAAIKRIAKRKGLKLPDSWSD